MRLSSPAITRSVWLLVGMLGGTACTPAASGPERAAVASMPALERPPGAATLPRGSATAPVPHEQALRFPAVYPSEHAALQALERDLARAPVTYARKDLAGRFRPQGLYFEPHDRTLWAWSRAHPEQRGFALRDGRWQEVGARTGPLDTRRCVALQRTRLTLCVGLLEPGGLRAHGAPFEAELPARGGFRDVAASEGHGRVYVIDAYLDALWILDLRGALRGRVPLTPGAYGVGRLGDDALFVLASSQPRLSVLPLDDRGMPGAPIGIETAATIRAAQHDAQRDLLWTAGPRQAVVRRNRGYVENLESFVYAYPVADLLRGQATPVHAVDLAAEGLADPVALAVAESRVHAVAAGSHRLVRIDPGPGHGSAPESGPGLDAGSALRVTTRRSGFVPRDVLAVDGWVFTAGMLDDRLHVHRGDELAVAQVLALDDHDPARAPTEYEIGEVLFHSKSLWADTPRNRFTCQSCHWDGLTDYRVHPGFAESRWEQIRPAAGVGMLAPIFSPGQAADLTIAVHGFVRALDERYWTAREHAAWLADIEVEVAPGQRRRLSGYQVRRALLTYLARLPVEPGFLRAPGQAFSRSALRGATLFWRDCARCHQPAPRLGAGVVLGREAALDYLVHQPLAFGAAQRARTGVEPYFTEQGNRISPLTQLGRGGPYFSDGSARTLPEALLRTNPSSDLVHAPGNAAAPFYTPGEVQELIDFLLSI